MEKVVNNPMIAKPMTAPVLSIRDMHKRYGRIHAADGLTLDVGQGSIYGLLGPNGSGKTTTLGVILGILRADSGTYSWFGKTPSSADRKRIGSILEQPLFYPFLTAFRNLQIIADIKGLSYEGIPEVLETVRLKERTHSKFRTFSYGMKQRLAIAAALLGKPEVLIFDEPTNGLDPQGIAEIRELITLLGREGYTIILASHLLDEVQKTCSHVAVLNKGRLLFQGKVSEVLTTTGALEIACEDNRLIAGILKEVTGIFSVDEEEGILLVRVGPDWTPHKINELMISRGIVLNHLYMRKKTLETQFLELLREAK